MRIEIDKATEEALDHIKVKLYLYGKGHTNTIAFLVKHYKDTQNLGAYLDKRLKEIPGIVDQNLRSIFRDFVKNLFTPRD